MKRLFLLGATLCILIEMTAYKSWATIASSADTIPTEVRTDSMKIYGRMMLEFEASTEALQAYETDRYGISWRALDEDLCFEYFVPVA